MELENRDYKALSEDEASDDEDGGEQQVVPSEWDTYQFDNLIMDEGPHVS